MDGTHYKEAVDVASDVLAEAMFEDAEELINEGRQLDRNVKKVMQKVGREVVGRLFQMLGGVLVAQAKRKGMTVHSRDEVEFSVLYGTLGVESVYLYDPVTGQSSRPLREHFGVWGNSYSDGVARALCDFGMEESFELAAERFTEHYDFEVPAGAVRRHTEKTGRACQEFIEQILDQGRAQYQIASARRARLADEMIVELDGCLIRCGRWMSAKEARQQTDDADELERLKEYEDDELVRLLEFKEVRTGLARRPGQVEPTYVCRRGSWGELGWQVFGAACHHGLNFDTQVVAVGDGAFGLKEALEEQFAHLQYVLDKPHLRHHFFETAAVLGYSQGFATGWVEKHIDKIAQGKVGLVLAELNGLLSTFEPPPEDDPHPEKTSYGRLNRLIKHLERFYNCVDYDEYENKDWPIGSGEVESAHRYVPQARLKLPGACWREENLNPMCALRVMRANGWWDDFWAWLEGQRQAAAA